MKPRSRRIRALDRPYCESPRRCAHERAFREIPDLRDPDPVGRRARVGRRRDLLQAPRSRAVRRARAAQRQARQPRDRVGSVAARAECLVHARVRRERGRHQAQDGDAAAAGHRAGVPVKVFSGKRREPRGRGDGSAASPRSDPNHFRWRANFVFALLVCGALGLVWRAVELQLKDHKFLAGQGDARFSRVATITATRGTITDRYGEPLAVSTPVDSIWVNPKELALASDQLPRLAKALKRDKTELARRVTSNLDREFLYLARHMQPAEAQKIRQLEIPGVYLAREYRRYYPAGEVAGHVLGFTSVDDEGQEGLELAFDHWLAGEDGQKRIIQDRYGRMVQDVESIRAVRPGRDLWLSIDLRIQYLAYRGLKSAIRDTHARAGSVVVLDVTTGEVLAMVNQPSYNPNDRSQLTPGMYRNRAVTDIF